MPENYCQASWIYGLFKDTHVCWALMTSVLDLRFIVGY